jgi:hypothetical protein
MLNKLSADLLPPAIRQVDLSAISQKFLLLAAILAGLLLVAGYLQLPTQSIFGHDEVHYYEDFSAKLPEDGRWLNFFLHGYLRSVPLPIWSMLFLLLSWSLYFRLARGVGFEPIYASLIASTTLLASTSVEMSIWPATTSPALMVALLASLMQQRAIDYRLIYGVAGILMFGSMQTIYFLLPLLFTGDFLNPRPSVNQRWQLLLSHLCWWVVGAIIGVVFMSLILWLKTGHFGPEPSSWRNTQPVQDWPDLVRNSQYVVSQFFRLLEQLLRNAGVTWGFILIIGLLAILRLKALLGILQAWLLMGSVMIGFFVFCLPLAPMINLRSLIAMTAVVILSLALVPGHSAAGRMIGALILLKCSFNFALYDQAFLALHQRETAWHLEKLKQLVPGNPAGYAYLGLTGVMDTARPEAFVFNEPSRMHPILLTLGARQYLDCRIEARCQRIGAESPVMATIPFADGQLEFTVDPANIGIIRYRAD